VRVIEATKGTELLQVPPVVTSVSCVVNPEHITVTPVIGAGNGFTNTGVVIIQPVGKV
jgi:hypothetical protein